ncbi:hypothetical protein R8510_04734 [Ralstonia chuxiongensis]|nr:hypothetical protein R8510_04734 [Ralstonia chuxiongensis]
MSTKRTRKRELLDEMDRVVPWAELMSLIEPHYPKGKTGRPPFDIPAMLRIHFPQQWFGLSDPAMEAALHDIPLYREFAGLDGGRRDCPMKPQSCVFGTCWRRTILAPACLPWSTVC